MAAWTYKIEKWWNIFWDALKQYDPKSILSPAAECRPVEPPNEEDMATDFRCFILNALNAILIHCFLRWYFLCCIRRLTHVDLFQMPMETYIDSFLLFNDKRKITYSQSICRTPINQEMIWIQVNPLTRFSRAHYFHLGCFLYGHIL